MVRGGQGPDARSATGVFTCRAPRRRRHAGRMDAGRRPCIWPLASSDHCFMASFARACFSCKWPRKLAVRLWWSTSTKPSVPRSRATERNHARPVLNCVSILKAFESRRSGLRCALGSMAKSVPPCAAFGDWRCISESLRGVGVASASSLLCRESKVSRNQLIWLARVASLESNWWQTYRPGVSPTKPEGGVTGRRVP